MATTALSISELQAHPFVKALEDERNQALRRAEEAEARAAEEACKVKQLSQENTKLTLTCKEMENVLEQRLEFAEKSLAQRLKAMEGVMVKVEAERDQYRRELQAYQQGGGNATEARAERKQIVEDLRALKSDAENSLEQRLEAAEKELTARLQGIEARVARAQEVTAASGTSSSDQELIHTLTREKTELRAQLQEALAKLEEQQSTMQDERATFWEELDLMRMDKERRSNSMMQNTPQATRLVTPIGSSLSSPAPTSTPTPRVVRVNGKNVVESTSGAMSGSRYAGLSLSVTAAPVVPEYTMASTTQRAVFYP